jgi:hypothetical protein
VLDPAGERYRLATAHCDGCPACRAYVLSLRGLAAALPPVLLSWGPLAAALGGGRGGGQLAEAARHGAQPSVAGVSPGSGAAGASGAAGGGWLLTGGGVGAKLAVGCLLALSVGGGCVALDTGGSGQHGEGPHRALSHAARLAPVRAAQASAQVPLDTAGHATAPARLGSAVTAPAERARREFGPEQVRSSDRAGTSAVARASSRESTPSGARTSSYSASASAIAETGSAAGSGSQTGAAEREFAPG